VSHPTCEVPFLPRRSGEYRKGMIPARPLYQGGCGSVWDPEPSKERGAHRQRFGPSCVLLKRVPQGRTESGGVVLAAHAGPRVPSGGVTLKRLCTYRPSVIYLIVNKLLSLSLFLVHALFSVAERRATRPNGEWGYSTRRHMLGHESPEAVSPERGVVLIDLQSSI
jgi:hypothetical protein